MPDSDAPVNSENTKDSQIKIDRDRIPPAKPPTAEDWRRLKRTAQQLVETIDNMQKRAKG